MPEERLLEKLRRWSTTGPLLPASSSEGELLNSVTSHIRQILNTQQGSVPIAEDYGLPNTNELFTHFNPAVKEDLAEKLTEVLTRYEPRLREVKVEVFNPNRATMQIRCQITGKIVSGTQEIPVYLTSLLTQRGRVIVK